MMSTIHTMMSLLFEDFIKKCLSKLLFSMFKSENIKIHSKNIPIFTEAEAMAPVFKLQQKHFWGSFIVLVL